MTGNLNTKISVSCPVCRQKGSLNINEKEIQNNARGISSINIGENMICEHSFMIYVDKNLDVRDSFTCDFKIELPEMEIEYDSSRLSNRQYDIDLIKINMIPSLLARILRAVYFGKEVIIISNEDFLNEQFINFFHSIFEDNFDARLFFLKRVDYLKNKKDFKKHVVLNGNDIINDKDKIFNSKKNIIENIIIQKFYGVSDEKSSLILLSNENIKAYRLSNSIKDYFVNCKEKLDIKNLINYLKQNFNNISIFPDYLNFLFDIAEHFFRVNIPLSFKITSKLLL